MFYVVLTSAKYLFDAAELEIDQKARAKAGFEVDFDYEDQNVRYGDTMTVDGIPAPIPNFTFKLKIVIGFLQILTSMVIGLEVRWPDNFKTFVQWFGPVNLDFFQATGVGCLWDSNYYDKLWLFCAMPVFLIAIVFGLYVCPTYIREHDKKVRKIVRRKAWRLLLFALFLVYPGVSSIILRLYVCKEVNDVDYLVADFSLQCSGDTYKKHSLGAAVMILLYPIGIPLFMFYSLATYRYDKYSKFRLDENGIRAQLGFLYDAYERKFWWFEMADMANKLAISSLIPFFPEQHQLPVALIVTYLYTAAIYLGRPYIRKGDDRLHLLAQTEISLFILSGYIFNLDYDEDNRDVENIVAALMIAIVCSFLMLFFYQSYQAVRKNYNKVETKGEPEVELEEGGSKGSNTSFGQVDRRDFRHAQKFDGLDTGAYEFEQQRNPLWLADGTAGKPLYNELEENQMVVVANPMLQDQLRGEFDGYEDKLDPLAVEDDKKAADAIDSDSIEDVTTDVPKDVDDVSDIEASVSDMEASDDGAAPKTSVSGSDIDMDSDIEASDDAVEKKESDDDDDDDFKTTNP